MYDDQRSPNSWDDYAYSGNAWGFQRPLPDRETRIPDGNQMIVQVAKSQEVDNDIAEKMLSDFIDWLDNSGLLREGTGTFEHKYNIDVVKYYLDKEQGIK